MSETQAIGAGDVTEMPPAELVETDTHALAVVTHPETGEEAKFLYPKDNTDRMIRYEHADGTLGEFANPNSDEPEGGYDPNVDDVIWDGRLGRHVPRVSVLAAEAGAGADAGTVATVVTGAESGQGASGQSAAPA